MVGQNHQGLLNIGANNQPLTLRHQGPIQEQFNWLKKDYESCKNN